MRRARSRCSLPPRQPRFDCVLLDYSSPATPASTCCEALRGRWRASTGRGAHRAERSAHGSGAQSKRAPRTSSPRIVTRRPERLERGHSRRDPVASARWRRCAGRSQPTPQEQAAAARAAGRRSRWRSPRSSSAPTSSSTRRRKLPRRRGPRSRHSIASGTCSRRSCISSASCRRSPTRRPRSPAHSSARSSTTWSTSRGRSYTLYTLSGAPREAFENFGHPHATPVFAPTFYGTAIVRSDDITKDPRYGQAPPHYGMPPGHLPVRSYLAVPVMSRTGTVIGGLFFGHEQTGVFTERAERLATGIAAWAAVAMDNARLYEAEQRARSDAEAGEQGEERVPRQHVARAAHAAQRDRRLRGAARRGDSRAGHRPPAGRPRAHQAQPASSALAHQRHPELREARGGARAIRPAQTSR